LEATKVLIRNLVKKGLPDGDVYEYMALQMLKEGRKAKVKFKKRKLEEINEKNKE